MKKTLAFFAALAVLLALAGCSGDGKDLEEKATDFFDKVEDGFDQLEERADDLDEKLSGTSDESPEETPEPEPTAEPVPETASGDDIRPEIKEAIDSYEDFFNEYADFMASYDASDLSAMTQYLSMLEQYTETMQKFDDMGDADLTDAELLYYTQATLRIEQRLLEVTG